MSNALGLTLIAIGIGLLIGSVIFIQYMARNYPETRIGRICVKLDKFIENLPDD
jgi:hypothetical protein